MSTCMKIYISTNIHHYMYIWIIRTARSLPGIVSGTNRSYLLSTDRGRSRRILPASRGDNGLTEIRSRRFLHSTFCLLGDRGTKGLVKKYRPDTRWDNGPCCQRPKSSRCTESSPVRDDGSTSIVFQGKGVLRLVLPSGRPIDPRRATSWCSMVFRCISQSFPAAPLASFPFDGFSCSSNPSRLVTVGIHLDIVLVIRLTHDILPSTVLTCPSYFLCEMLRVEMYIYTFVHEYNDTWEHL